MSPYRPWTNVSCFHFECVQLHIELELNSKKRNEKLDDALVGKWLRGVCVARRLCCVLSAGVIAFLSLPSSP